MEDDIVRSKMHFQHVEGIGTECMAHQCATGVCLGLVILAKSAIVYHNDFGVGNAQKPVDEMPADETAASRYYDPPA